MPRLAAQEGGGFPFDFDQRYLTPEGPKFPDELGAAVIAQILLEGEKFLRYLDHLPGGKPEKLTRISRRVQILAGEDYPEEGLGRQIIVPYHPSIHPDTARPYHLAEAMRKDFLDAVREPRRLSTVRKRGASLTDFGKADPWAPRRGGAPAGSFGSSRRVAAGQSAGGGI